MFTFGSQINPALGRQDFSAILQGGQARAQGIAQAGVIRGQAMAQMADTLSKAGVQAIGAYVQNKEKKEQEASATNAVANIFKSNPFLAKTLNIPQDPNGDFDKGAVKEFIKVYGPGQAVQVASALDQMNRAQQAQEDQRKAAQVAAYLQQGGGNLPSPVSSSAFTPEQQMAGRAAYTQQARQQAELAKTLAETAALRVPKPEKAPTGTEALYQSLRQAAVEANNGQPLTAAQDAKIRQNAIEAGRAQSTTNVGPGLTTTIYSDLAKEKGDIFALREAVANYDAALNEITGSKAFSGPAGAIKYAGARALQVVGSDAFKNEADAYQAAGSALANSVLAIARQLPGASSDRDVIFLQRVATGDERVPSAEVLKKIKARVEAKVARLESSFQNKVQAFGEASKGDSNAEFAFKVLSAKPRTQVPSLPANF
jgi:predicted RNA-binding protein YlxR (DUF448 family)